jgi:hypothetical protein
MGEKRIGLEDQLEVLTDEIEYLRNRVEDLTVRMEALESREAPSVQKSSESQKVSVPVQKVAPPKEGVLKKAGTGSLLPRIATVCFALVVALILRTITDNEIINTQVGSLLGMGYATSLILAGWWLYSRKNRLAPVFPASGLLLLFSIILETHSRFQSLSTMMAFIILIGAGAIVIVMGFRYRASFQICAAALGSGMVGMALGFPYPLYPMLAMLLFGGCVTAFIAWRRDICPSLRWTTLGLVLVFWLFWSFKLSVPAVYDELMTNVLYLRWFFPYLFLFWVFYIVTNIYRMATDNEDLGFYESLLPSIVGLGGFWAAWSVVVPWYNNTQWLGMTGVVAGLLHLGVGYWLAKRNKDGAIGSTTYTFAAVLLLSLGVASVFSNLIWSVPVLSISAYIMARMADSWRSGGIRCTSYLFQLAAGLMAIATGVVAADISSPVVGGLVISTLITMSFLQYRWCRSHAPTSVHSAFFSWLDRKDFSAVILLLTGLISSFFLLRLGLYQILARTISDFDYIFRGGQTVFINLGAVLLLILASRRKNNEILTVAIVVGILGMLKSFIFDLFGIKGMSLVLSVFSSGVVAAVGSVVSTRWQGKKEKIKTESATAQS